MAVFKEIKTITGGASSAVITHNLGDANAVLRSCTCGGWPGRPFITARATNTITVTFGIQAPAGGGTLDVEVNS